MEVDNIIIPYQSRMYFVVIFWHLATGSVCDSLSKATVVGLCKLPAKDTSYQS